MAALGVVLSLCRTGFADYFQLRADGIFLEPGNSSHIVVRSAWGLLDSRDAGRSWSYVCTDAFGLPSGNAGGYDVALAKGGRILLADGFGGLWTSDDGCDWKSMELPQLRAINALARSDDAGSRFWLLAVGASDAGVVTQIYRTGDRGDTWTEDKGAFPIDAVPFSATAAPSDPKRLYVSGRTANGGPPILLSSADDGGNWQMHAVPEDDPSDVEITTIALVHPTRPDAVVVRIDESSNIGGRGTDRLWATPDAGTTWIDLYKGHGSIPGSTIAPGGGQLLISGPFEGIQGAPLDDIFDRGLSTFDQVFPAPTWALAASASGVFVGTDSFADGGRGYVLGLLGFATNFTGLASYRNITLARCPNDSDVSSSQCEDHWQKVRSFLSPPSPSGNSPPDAGETGGSSGEPSAGGGSSGKPRTDSPASDGTGADTTSGTPGNAGPSATDQRDTRSGATGGESCACRLTRREAPAAHRELAMLAGLLFLGRKRSRSSKRV